MNVALEVRTKPGTGRRLWEGDVRLLLDVCAKFRYPARNRTVLLLGVDAGLTLAEIARLKRKDVMDHGEYVRFVKVRGKASRRIAMSDRLFESVLRTVGGVAGYPDGPLILPERGEDLALHMEVKSVRYVLYKLFDKAGLIGVNASSCRRTFIENALASRDKVGATMQDVCAVAGLKSVRSLAVYTRGDLDVSRQNRLIAELMCGRGKSGAAS